MLDRHWSEKLEELLKSWESLYRQGIDQCAQQLFQDGTSEFLQLLQERIDQQREENIEEARDQWLDECDEGKDRMAQDLRPTWPEKQLKMLDERIAVCRAAQRKVQPMLGDNDEVEDFKVGGTVPGNPDCTFVRLLGAGGFGQAWLAHNKRMHKDVVFKFCSPSALTSLKNETELLARIDRLSNDERFKEAFVQMLATHIGEPGEPPHYVTYEFIPEGNLRQYMKGRCLKPFEASEVILDLAEKVALIHGLPDPIVHRDLKPENILVVRSVTFPPKVKIGDFGIGGVSFSAIAADRKATKDYAENCFCTQGYASVEQKDAPRRREPSDDVHALGVIWYELLTGEKESRAGTGAKERLLAMGMTSAQIEVLRKCFDDEKHRWKNAKEMAEKIRELFPLLRQEVQNDIKQIAERRKKGENCREYIKELGKARIGIWKQAAEQGLPEAQWLYGMCWEMGIEADPKLNKYEQAASSYRKAADHGNADAQYCLACYQRFGLGGIDKRNTGKKDEGLSQLLSTSIDEFGLSTRACNCLESESITTIGELIRLNEDDLLEIRNFGKTTLDELREKLAAKGLRLDRQPNWLKKAAVGGQPDAQFEFGLQLLDTVKERTQSGADARMLHPLERQGEKLVCQAALAGHLEARLWCVREWDHREGLGSYIPVAKIGKLVVPRQFPKEWLEEAAKTGSIEARFLLGKCFETGTVVVSNPDRDRAIESYRVAAETGHLEAQFRLSECLRGMIWDKSAAENHDLSDLVKLQPKVMVQCNEAVRWCMTAANGGHAGAQFRLGCSLWTGWDGENTLPLLHQEQENGLRWICKAALQGHQEAMNLLTGVKDELTSDERIDRFFWKYPVAWKTLHILAHKGNETAAFRLAKIYSRAGKLRNHEKAREWLYKATELRHPEAIDLVLRGAHSTPWEDDEFLDEDDFEKTDAEVNEEFEQLEESLKCLGMAAHLVRDYQHLAELGHEGAAKRLAEMGDASTNAIVDMLRPADQQPPLPKTP